MTGLDYLRDELAKRGLSKTQIESKSVAVVLDVIANTGERYTNLQGEEAHASNRLYALERTLEVKERRLSSLEFKLNELRREAQGYKDYIDEFNKSLLECETQEGRDAMRIAQMFVNSVDVDTKYDNTAYIIGLASILSGGKINAINELKKINKKIPISDFSYI